MDFNYSELPQLTKNYIQKYSKSQLSRNTGINPRTLDRISLSEIDLEDFKYPEKIIHLINEVSDVRNYEEALFLAPPKIKKRLKITNDVSVKSLGKKVVFNPENVNIENLLNNEPKRLVVFLLACAHHGTNLEEVLGITGDEGAYELAFLLQRGLLISKGNRITTTLPNNSSYFSRRFLKNNMRKVIEFYVAARAGKNHNYIFQHVQSLNKRAIKKIHKLTHEFYEKQAEIMNDTSSFGEIPYFSCLVQDSFADIDLT